MTRETELAPPPKHCDCGEPASVVLIEVVRQSSGKTMKGAFSEFRVFGTKRVVLEPAYRFKQWVVSCSKCYEPGEGK